MYRKRKTLINPKAQKNPQTLTQYTQYTYIYLEPKPKTKINVNVNEMKNGNDENDKRKNEINKYDFAI